MLLDILNQIDSIVWGPWLLVLLVGTGIWLTFRLTLLQVVKLPRALKLIFFARNKGEGDIDSFKALCTALAATVGTGNIVGVATAINSAALAHSSGCGSPPSSAWATKYAEGCLAVKYRQVDDNGNIAGGPMYYIEMGLGKKWKPLAVLFAFFGCMVALLGSGTTTQMNAIISSVEAGFGISTYITCAVITVLVAIITFGGLQSIAKAAEKIVPAMPSSTSSLPSSSWHSMQAASRAPSARYSPAHSPAPQLPAALQRRRHARYAKRYRQSLFSNESGLGSAPIVAAAAKTKWPAEQGLISMTGTFIDTIIICTLTGLTIIVSGQCSVTPTALNLHRTHLPSPMAASRRSFSPYLSHSSPSPPSSDGTTTATLLGIPLRHQEHPLLQSPLPRHPRIRCFLKLESIWALADIVNGSWPSRTLLPSWASQASSSQKPRNTSNTSKSATPNSSYKARRIGKR